MFVLPIILFSPSSSSSFVLHVLFSLILLCPFAATEGIGVVVRSNRGSTESWKGEGEGGGAMVRCR